MCGIVGAMSRYLSVGEIDRFRDLMIVSNLRGYEGAGIISVDEKQTVKFVKSLGSGLDLIKKKSFEDLITAKNRPSILVGHTRWPTKGDITAENTHPHLYKNIIGVHNGTMDTIMDERVPEGESDSALIFKAIQEHGFKEFYQNSRGAMALVWVDTQEGTLNFFRNDKRPLAMASVADGSTVYWASEYGMLHFVLTRAGMKPEVEVVPLGNHIRFDLEVGKKVTHLSKTYVPQWEVKSSALGPFPGDQSKGSTTSTSHGGQRTTSSKPPKNNVVKLPVPQRRYFTDKQTGLRGYWDEATKCVIWENGTPPNYIETVPGYNIHINTAEVILNKGCDWCGVPQFKTPDGKLPHVHWYASREFVCAECEKEDLVQEFLKDEHKKRDQMMVSGATAN